MNFKSDTYAKQISIIAGLFFTIGFITWLNSALIPFMKSICQLRESEAYLVASASYISFAIMALPSSVLLHKVGYKKGMFIALLLMSLGAWGFIPAAQSRSYGLFLLAIFVQGSGMTILQTAINPYITILGPIDSGAKRISIMGITNKLAGVAASVVFGSLLLGDISEVTELLSQATETQRMTLLNQSASKVFLPYSIMGASFLAIAIAVLYAPLQEIDPNSSEDHNAPSLHQKSILKHPHLILGVVTLFFYVGAEVIAVDSIISYGITLGFTPDISKYFASATLIFMILGYIIGVVCIPRYISQTRALQISALLGILLSVIIIYSSSTLSILCVALLGLANALVWPAVWPLAIRGLGSQTKTGAALLIIGICGGAIIPPIYGFLVDSSILQLTSTGVAHTLAKQIASTQSYWILIPCYTFILYYALIGHKTKAQH